MFQLLHRKLKLHPKANEWLLSLSRAGGQGRGLEGALKLCKVNLASTKHVTQFERTCKAPPPLPHLNAHDYSLLPAAQRPGADAFDYHAQHLQQTLLSFRH